MRITRVLSHRSLAVTPNHVTICAIVVGLIASVLACRGGVPRRRDRRRAARAQLDPRLVRRRARAPALPVLASSASGSTTCPTTSSTTCSSPRSATASAASGSGSASPRPAGACSVSIITYVERLPPHRHRRRLRVPLVVRDRQGHRRRGLRLRRRRSPGSARSAAATRSCSSWMIACVAGFPYWVVGHGARDRRGQRVAARAALHRVPAREIAVRTILLVVAACAAPVAPVVANQAVKHTSSSLIDGRELRGARLHIDAEHRRHAVVSRPDLRVRRARAAVPAVHAVRRRVRDPRRRAAAFRRCARPRPAARAG